MASLHTLPSALDGKMISFAIFGGCVDDGVEYFGVVLGLYEPNHKHSTYGNCYVVRTNVGYETESLVFHDEITGLEE